MARRINRSEIGMARKTIQKVRDFSSAGRRAGFRLRAEPRPELDLFPGEIDGRTGRQDRNLLRQRVSSYFERPLGCERSGSGSWLSRDPGYSQQPATNPAM